MKRSRVRWYAVCLGVVSAVGVGYCQQPAAVLDTYSAWRIFHEMKPPLLMDESGQVAPVLTKVSWLDMPTPPPPADWMNPEMDDSTWLSGTARCSARTPYLARLFLRGRFEVTNPGAVEGLSLTVTFRGGIVVYLNGKEIGRSHLPAGPVTGDMLATPYPKEAFVDAQGKLIERQVPREVADLRTRTVTLQIPGSLLRRGVNLLAVELVRAAYPAILRDLHPYGVGGQSSDPGLRWPTCEIRSVSLSAEDGRGVVPNASRPAGLWVWKADTLSGDTDADLPDRTQPQTAVRIVSPRNGTLFGKVRVAHNGPLKNLSVSASDLKGDRGLIPSSSVSFLYGVKGGGEIVYGYEDNDRGLSPYPYGTSFLHTLFVTPPAEVPVSASLPEPLRGAVVPVWIRVKVPPETPAGTYRGTLTVAATGSGPVAVPLEVNVLPWKIPDPAEFRTWIELIQSPDTLAVEYGVPLWSDRHFDLIGQSFRLIRDTGAGSLYIPAIAHTNLGNEESMIRWIRKPDGGYGWDFSVMDRYLDTAERNLGKPKLIVLQVWEVYMNTKEAAGRRFGEILEKNQKNTGGAPLVTFLNPDGTTENGVIPKLSDPASKEIWKAFFSTVKERLRTRGLDDRIVLGMFTDSMVNKADTQFFCEVAPGLEWVQQGHNVIKGLHGLVATGYTANWWSGQFPDELVNQRSDAISWRRDAKAPPMKSLMGWNNRRLDAYFPRMSRESFPLTYWRFLCETAVTSDIYRGIGRVGADFWPALKNKEGRRVAWVNDRFEEVSGYLHELRSYLLVPGPDGPAATNRLIALIEGIAESEARILIEDALVKKNLSQISPELAERCQTVLDGRFPYMWRALDSMTFGGWGVTAWRFGDNVAGHAWFLSSNWQERTERLFSLAGEVEKALAR